MTQGRFTTGSTLWHVIRMTIANSIGIMFVFLVDAANLFWINYQGSEVEVAAIGLAYTIQFAVMSISIGMMIAASAICARTLGQGNRRKAARQVTAAMIISVVVMAFLSIISWIFRGELLTLIGATGVAHQLGSDYLAITILSMPFMAAGMTGSGILRADGQAINSMLVTVAMGMIALILDPIVIVYMGLGVKGAAIVVFLSRVGGTLVALYLVNAKSKLFSKLRKGTIFRLLPPFAAVAIPAVLTQMSTPFGNAIITRFIAEYGDSAIAGWSVIGRLTMLAFGGIFALSGAVGSILGQNYGAGLLDRVRSTYLNSIYIGVAYTIVIWAVLFLATPQILALFKLSGEGATVLKAFTHIAAGSFIFTTFLFVSNAAFNNLGRPVYSTFCNWARDGILMWPAVIGCTALMGASGPIYGQAIATIFVGILAAGWAWHYIDQTLGQNDPTDIVSFPSFPSTKAAQIMPVTPPNIPAAHSNTDDE